METLHQEHDDAQKSNTQGKNLMYHCLSLDLKAYTVKITTLLLLILLVAKVSLIKTMQ